MLCTYFVHRFALDETCAFWGWEIVWEIVSGIKPVNGLRRSSPPPRIIPYIFLSGPPFINRFALSASDALTHNNVAAVEIQIPRSRLCRISYAKRLQLVCETESAAIACGRAWHLLHALNNYSKNTPFENACDDETRGITRVDYVVDVKGSSTHSHTTPKQHINKIGKWHNAA